MAAATPAAPEFVVLWRAQPGPQTALIACPVYEVFYGGARGGGKTESMLGDWLAHSAKFGSHAQGVFFRHTLPQLDEVIHRTKALFPKLGASYGEQAKTWTMNNGATLKFRYLERTEDAENYQGQNYTRLYFEEITNWADPAGIDRLRATLRSAAGIPVGFRATGNPGGPGHHWVKARYIDPAPTGYKILKDENGLERVFIPAKVSDNKLLLSHDPLYVDRLKQSGSPELVRAWLGGDWSVITGAFFPEFRSDVHVIAPFTLPAHWIRFRAMDWGSAKPFSVGWYAVSDGELTRIPRGALIKYREWYGASGINVGLKMTAEEVADGIKARQLDGEAIKYSVLDPAAFSQDGGPSIAERMGDRGVYFDRADNKRVKVGGAMGGWDQVRARLKGDETGPALLFFDTCIHTVRTLPALQHDIRKPEDVDTDGEDHAPDETRYACMSRPWVGQAPDNKPTDWNAKPTFKEVFWDECGNKGRRIA